MSISRSLGLAALLGLAGCKLQEVTVPLGSPIVAVQCVLSLDSNALAQYVIVERSITGTIKIPNQDSLRGPPRPPLPISNALVYIVRDDGDTLAFSEISDTLGVYRADWPLALPFMQPGHVYRLHVITPQADTVTGETRMPFAPVVSGVPPDGATFNRDRDSLHVAWSGAAFSHGVYFQVRPRDVSKFVRLVLFTDSSHFTVPGDLAFPLPGDTLPPDVWIPGTRETFTIAAMDSNFFRFFHTANDPFTGSGFANSLTGGIGVFGSMVPINRTYDVIADIDHPWEGDYTLAVPPGFIGISSGIVHLFVSRDRPFPVLVSGLVDSTDALDFGSRAESTGFVTSDSVLTLAVVSDPPGEPVRQGRFVIKGRFNPAGVTTGTVYAPSGAVAGTFTLTRR